jgi:D-beta-D-heptose 7-phosphate kinase / D-beta-D-heptose 1-phosphate adenosyltransferase
MSNTKIPAPYPPSSAKIVVFEKLLEIAKIKKAAGQTIVWTNGCFDILHAGHAIYLERARALGDLLLVGLNTDASVAKSKGPQRPIISQDQRALLVAALACVDYVVLYDEASPIELIRQLKPDIYAKGGDYNVDTINQDERRLMESLGGRIELLTGMPGISTTVVIENILKLKGTA